MTDVKKDKTTRIRSEEEARALYKPAQPQYSGKMGLEVEMPLYARGAAKPAIPPASEMMQMQRELKEKGHDAQLEPAGVLEYASPPMPIADVVKLVARAREDIRTFEDTANAHGFARAPFSVLPTTTPQEAMENKVSRERLEALISVMPEGEATGIVKLSLLTTGVQASFSPKDDEEMFRMVTRGYMLTPLLYAAMASSSGYAANDNARCDIHLRGKYYEDYGPAGGISPAFLKSASGEDLVREHVREVFDAPMFFAYGLDGKIIPGGPGSGMTFRKLAAQGLDTLSNYELAETFLYNDIKIANLRDGEGAVVGKRVEVRAADSGRHQPFSVLLLTAAIIPDGQTAQAFDALLKDYGFTGDPRADAKLLNDSRRAAVDHNGRFMDVAFGNGSLRDFAADVASLLVAHYEKEPSVAPDVSRLADILLTGECDAKTYAAKYHSLQDVTADLQKAAPAPAATPKRTGPQNKA